MKHCRISLLVVGLFSVTAICSCGKPSGTERQGNANPGSWRMSTETLEIREVYTDKAGHKHTRVVYSNRSPKAGKGFISTHEMPGLKGHTTVIKEKQYTEGTSGSAKIEVTSAWESGVDSSGRKYKKLLYNNPDWKIQSHDNYCVQYPVSDGRIVLVKSGRALGAMILRGQPQPSRNGGIDRHDDLVWEWYYRTDGKGTFKASESGLYHHGKGSQFNWESQIEFGPFRLGWSSCTKGQGWILYDEFPQLRTPPNHTVICATSHTDVTKIDAASSKWIYKANQADPGVHADGSKVK